MHVDTRVIGSTMFFVYFLKKQCEDRPAKGWRLNQRLVSKSTANCTDDSIPRLLTTTIGTIVFSVVCHTRSQLQDVQIQADGEEERLNVHGGLVMY
jgi:hypothetical protein